MNGIDSAIIVALITLIGTIITVVISNGAMRDSITHELDKHNAVQDEQLKELTREVRRHNNFAERIPTLETRVDNLEVRIDKMESKP